MPFRICIGPLTGAGCVPSLIRTELLIVSWRFVLGGTHIFSPVFSAGGLSDAEAYPCFDRSQLSALRQIRKRINAAMNFNKLTRSCNSVSSISGPNAYHAGSLKSSDALNISALATVNQRAYGTFGFRETLSPGLPTEKRCKCKNGDQHPCSPERERNSDSGSDRFS